MLPAYLFCRDKSTYFYLAFREALVDLIVDRDVCAERALRFSANSPNLYISPSPVKVEGVFLGQTGAALGVGRNLPWSGFSNL